MESFDDTFEERRKMRDKNKRKRKRKVRIQRFFILGIIVLGVYNFGAGRLSNMVTQRIHVENTEVFEEGQEYPDSIHELYEKNKETKEFVRDYPTEHNKKHKINLKKEVTKGKIPLFLQWDERWGYETYGDDMMAITGCGPTCLSMVLCGLTGDASWSPIKVARFAMKNGYYESGSGSKWSLMKDGAIECGLMASELPLDENRIKDAIDAGNPVICIMGPGDFTTSGHYIVLCGIDENGYCIDDIISLSNIQFLFYYQQRN